MKKMYPERGRDDCPVDTADVMKDEWINDVQRYDTCIKETTKVMR